MYHIDKIPGIPLSALPHHKSHNHECIATPLILCCQLGPLSNISGSLTSAASKGRVRYCLTLKGRHCSMVKNPTSQRHRPPLDHARVSTTTTNVCITLSASSFCSQALPTYHSSRGLVVRLFGYGMGYFSEMEWDFNSIVFHLGTLGCLAIRAMFFAEPILGYSFRRFPPCSHTLRFQWEGR
jgi:hypothetical protein